MPPFCATLGGAWIIKTICLQLYHFMLKYFQASLNPCSDQPTNVESLPTKRIDRILHENNQTPNFAATRNQQQRMQWNRMPENPLGIHTAQASSYEDTEGQDPGYTCVLERHFHCPTRGPLSKSISNPILLADIPNMYLPDIPDIT